MADRPKPPSEGAALGGSLVLWSAPREEEPSEAAFTSLGTRRVDAAFLAHLLAARNRTPGQRGKKRAAPETGAAAYRNGLELLAPAPAARLSRSA
jgi:hypothetical protein